VSVHGGKMKVQIKSFSSHQTSKVIALAFALFTIPFSIMGVIGFFVAPEMKTSTGESIPNFPFLIFALAPLLYGFMFYIMNRLMCFGYNFIAKRVGGIEFETVESDNEH
ncbi:hypothetical protein, partial [Pseudoalteromonas sp. SG44-8]|uniref:hypothetical protein n=2 Tax=unclassified Pseudoalteromonas TaxID=194690 RepID=UPI001C727CA9